MHPFSPSRRAAANLCAVLILLSVAHAEPPGKTEPGITIGGFYGRAYPVIGSEVTRADWGLAFGYGKPEPHFRIGKIPAQLVYEAYYFGTRSQGIDHFPPFSHSIFGGLAYARYRWPRNHGVGAYFDVGIGLAYSDRSNRDLDARFNTTPYLGVGIGIPSGRGEWLVGVSYLHISNAGTKGNNQGINNLLYEIRYRF